MFGTILGVGIRIFSNSGLNVFQKLLTEAGNRSSTVNFYTYFGLSVLSLFLFPFFNLYISTDLIFNFFIMGILGALGNYFIIRALSIGELSSLAPINSYKPVIALLAAFIYLGEIPTLYSLLAILLIILGTYILNSNGANINKKAVFYRVLALIFSGSEAVFIKKIILLTNIPTSFALWALSGLIFALVFMLVGQCKFEVPKVKYICLLVFLTALMQYSTNYVFSKINVASALALFQLSTLLSVFLGVNIFNEKGFFRKLTASILMVVGAVIIILNN